MKTKIEVPDFVTESIENFYKEDFIEKEKALKALERKTKRANIKTQRKDTTHGK